MNYYERHLGDYAKDAGHLSLAEHGAYTLLLDRYYSTELPVPAEQVYRVTRARSKAEKAAVDAVLEEFFTLVDGAWVNGRASLEIKKFEVKRNASRENGARGGRPKTQENQCYDKPAGLVLGSENETQQKALQSPVTSNQSRAEDQKQKGGKPPALTLPDWLPESAWADWHAFRNQRKGWTHKARELSLTTLTKLRTQGHDPVAVIEQSIERGWTGLFEIKPPTGHAPRAGPTTASKPPIAQNFSAKTYEGTPDDQLPEFLRTDAA